MKKIILLTTTCLLLTHFSTRAQQNSIVRYFDKNWNAVSKDSAFFYTEFEPQTDGYKSTTRWIKSGKINTISNQADTLFTKRMGMSRSYYESGQLEDSSYYDPKTGDLLSTIYYYATGRLWAKYTYNPKNKTGRSEGYDENGKRIADFVFQREAQFKEGNEDWIKYLGENLKSKTPVKNGAPKGSYKVMMRFIVAPDGSLANVVPETRLGYGMEEEGMRVIKKSPKWTPAILLNKPVNAYRRQPLTFVVEEK